MLAKHSKTRLESSIFGAAKKKSRVFGGSKVDREFEKRMVGATLGSRTLDEAIMPNLGKSDVNEKCFVTA